MLGDLRVTCGHVPRVVCLPTQGRRRTTRGGAHGLARDTQSQRRTGYEATSRVGRSNL